MKLDQEQYMRYSRQLILPEIEWTGQKKILASRVLLVGVGGLGSPQALYLASAGIGTLGLLDEDRVDLTNLHRQVAHCTDELGAPKVDSAARRIQGLNPDVEVRRHHVRIQADNAFEIIEGYDIVVDCTDNFPVRYLLNDACVLLGKPLVHGAIHRFDGQATVFDPGRGGPCYRCLFPVPPPHGAVPSCAEAGVLGVLPGLIGMIQATEVIKLVLGQGNPLIGRLLLCETMEMSFQELSVKRDPACPICGDEPTIHELIDYEVFCGLAGSPSQTGLEKVDPVQGLRVVDLAGRLEAGEPITFLDVREPWEEALCSVSEDAVRLPYSKLTAQWESLLPYKDRNLVVCCLFGWKSAEACRMLQARGFDRLWNLEGGLEEWYLYLEQAQEERGEGGD